MSYPDGARRVPVPDLFFSRDLPELADGVALKLFLHLSWRVQRRARGQAAALAEAEILGDPVLRRGVAALGYGPEAVDQALTAALGQLARLHGSNDAEFAILVSDLYQNLGLGTELLTRLLEIGREEKLERIVAEILPENEGMKRVSAKLGFHLKLDRETRVVHAELKIQ